MAAKPTKPKVVPTWVQLPLFAALPADMAPAPVATIPSPHGLLLLRRWIVGEGGKDGMERRLGLHPDRELIPAFHHWLVTRRFAHWLPGCPVPCLTAYGHMAASDMGAANLPDLPTSLRPAVIARACPHELVQSVFSTQDMATARLGEPLACQTQAS